MNLNSNYLVSRKHNKVNTIVKINETVSFGNGRPVIIGGPCAVRDKESLIETAILLKKNGVDILRGGAFKPRKSPYSFQGLKKKGIEYLIAAKKETNLPIITELFSIDHLKKYSKDIDIIQVGSRNMSNYDFLIELGKINKPILLKRGMGNTYEEWLKAAEYIMKHGNSNIVLCERGIRSFENETRNTLDLQAIPIIKKYSHLPIIIDPSHAAGERYIIEPMSLAAIAGGADGLIIEVEKYPNLAICDKKQTIGIKQLSKIIRQIEKLKKI